MILGLTFFILNNFLIILLGSVIYFFSKETIRASGGNLSKLSFLALGLVLGLFLFYISFFVNYKIEKDTRNIFNILNPYMIYLILFSSMIDRRFFFPLLVFSIFGFIFNHNLNTGTSTVEEITLFFSWFAIKILILMILFFVPNESNFLKRNNKGIFLWTIIIFIVYMVISTIPLFIEISLFPDRYALVLKGGVINFLVLLLVFTTQMFIVYVIEKMYINFNKLETYSIKDDVSYYKMSLSQNRLKTILNEKKYNIGILLLFDIKTDDRNKVLKILDNIKLKVDEDYKNVFYFKATTNYYGVFIPSDLNINLDIIFKNNKQPKRTKDDELYNFEKAISDVSDEFDVKINASGSIYGVHSYNIKELIELSRFLFSPFIAQKNQSKITIYDFKRVREKLKERLYVSSLPISRKNTNISFLRAISKESIFYSNVYFEENSKKESITSFMDREMLLKDKEIILRNSAYQSLRDFDKKESSLIIYYPSTYLDSNDFSLNDFIKKVERYIPVEKIILGFFLNETFSEIFSKNVNLLRSKGVRFALVNPNSSTQKSHDLLKPEYLLQLNDKKNLLKNERVSLKIKSNASSLNVNLV